MDSQSFYSKVLVGMSETMRGDTAALESVVKGQWRGAVAEAWGNGQTPGRVVANVACAPTVMRGLLNKYQ